MVLCVSWQFLVVLGDSIWFLVVLGISCFFVVNCDYCEFNVVFMFLSGFGGSL